MVFLWFYFNDEGNNLDTNIANDNNFKSINRKHSSLKYLSNFWRSHEMPLINCKIELKLKWTKHCVLATGGNDNDYFNSDDIIFTIEDTKLYVPFVTLSSKDNQKLSKVLNIGFERSVY